MPATKTTKTSAKKAAVKKTAARIRSQKSGPLDKDQLAKLKGILKGMETPEPLRDLDTTALKEIGIEFFGIKFSDPTKIPDPPGFHTYVYNKVCAGVLKLIKAGKLPGMKTHPDEEGPARAAKKTVAKGPGGYREGSKLSIIFGCFDKKGGATIDEVIAVVKKQLPDANENGTRATVRTQISAMAKKQDRKIVKNDKNSKYAFVS